MHSYKLKHQLFCTGVCRYRFI